MNKLKLFSCAFLLFAGMGLAKAQFGFIKPDEMDEMHNRTLVVVVESPSDQLNEKLGKKHKADGPAGYSKAIDAFNKNFADAVNQFWKVSADIDNVEFKSLDEVNDITDKKNYVIMFCRSVTKEDLATPYPAKNGIMWWPNDKEVAHDRDFNSKMTVMGIALLEKFAKGAPIYQISMPDIYPTKEDLKYAVNVASTYITYKVNHRKDNPKKLDDQMLQENSAALRDRTLLLPRDYLDKRMTKAQMDKAYPFQYMIAGMDTVQRAIDSSDSRYAIALVVPSETESSPNGGLDYVQIAYTPDDGNLVAASGFPEIASDPKSGEINAASSSKQLITKKALMDFCMYIKDSGGDSDSGNKRGRK